MRDNAHMTNANHKKDTGSAKKDGGQRPTSMKTIALNKRARHDYSLEDRYEAGLMLQGWEVKALRAGRLQFADSYAMIISGELFLYVNDAALPGWGNFRRFFYRHNVGTAKVTITLNDQLVIDHAQLPGVPARG